jgi:hypothetical protein
LVACGAKRWETRSWPTRYRGPVAIHAAKSFPPWAREFAESADVLAVLPSRKEPLGAIVAVAYLADCQRTEELVEDGSIPVGSLEWKCGDYSPGRFAFWLRDIRPLPLPIGYRGALGLWSVPPEVQHQLESEVAGLLPHPNHPNRTRAR